MSVSREVLDANPYGAFRQVFNRPHTLEVSGTLSGLEGVSKNMQPGEMDVPGGISTLGRAPGLEYNDGRGPYVNREGYGTLADLVLSNGAKLVAIAEAPQFGASNDTPNVLNVFDATVSPGGSTGGGAAAVRSGLVDFALGGDGGGSLRCPAALQGLFAHLASSGVLLNASVGYEFGRPGVLTRDLALHALMLNLMRKEGAEVNFAEYLGGKEYLMPRLTFAKIPNLYFDKRINPKTGNDATIHYASRHALDFTEQMLRDLGHNFLDYTPPAPFKAEDTLFIRQAYMRRVGAAVGRSADIVQERLGRDIHKYKDLGLIMAIASATRTISERHEAEDNEVMETAEAARSAYFREHGIDALLSPTISGLEGPFVGRRPLMNKMNALKIAALSLAGRDPSLYAATTSFPEAYAANNIWASPASAFPTGYAVNPATGKYVPVSIQMTGQPGNDAYNFGVASELDQLLELGFEGEAQRHLDLNGSKHWLGGREG